MTELEHHAALAHRLERETRDWLLRARPLFRQAARKAPDVRVHFDLRGGAAGQVRHYRDGRLVIRYNLAMAAAQPEAFIAQTVPQMVMDILDFGMNVQEAISAPRISFAEPDILSVEEAIPEAVREELARRGHQVRTTRGLGNAHGLVIEWGPDGKPVAFWGGADPRGAGLAKGY